MKQQSTRISSKELLYYMQIIARRKTYYTRGSSSKIHILSVLSVLLVLLALLSIEDFISSAIGFFTYLAHFQELYFAATKARQNLKTTKNTFL
mmetsp:Transcript_29613/g.35213  ORF Transcript_29613/g.35213 Transcript_29613/m.35213 type:complete len:93 (+) Transcript_29613:459-737(+)